MSVFGCCCTAIILLLAPGKLAAAPLPAPLLLPGYPMLAGRVAILAWLPVPGAITYRVYCNGILALTVEGTQGVTPLPQLDGEFAFRVSALNLSEEEGERSAIRSITVKTIEAPGKVVAFPAMDRHAVDLVWGGVAGAMQYQAYRSVDGGPFQPRGTSRTASFRDEDVTLDAAFRYRVSVIDRYGQEGPPSQEAAVRLREAPSKPTLAQKLLKRNDQIRLLPVRETMSLESIGKWPIGDLSHLQVGSEGLVWVILPGPRLLLGLGENGQVVRQIGPELFNDLEEFRPHKMDIGPDGSFFITDLARGELLCLDTAGKVSWCRKAVPPPRDDERSWQGFPARYLDFSPRPSSVLVRAEDVLVADQRFQVIYSFGHDGAQGQCLTHYARGTTEWRLGRVGEIEDLGDDRTLITLPLQRRAIALDAQQKVVLDLESHEGKGAAFFMGLNGARRTHADVLLLTDPAMGTVLAVDAGTGNYLYHLGFHDKAEVLRMDRPRLADRDLTERFWVFIGGENRISVLSPVSPLAEGR